MLAPNAMQQRNRGLGQITSPKPVSNFAGRYHTNNVPYGSTTMTQVWEYNHTSQMVFLANRNNATTTTATRCLSLVPNAANLKLDVFWR